MKALIIGGLGALGVGLFLLRKQATTPDPGETATVKSTITGDTVRVLFGQVGAGMGFAPIDSAGRITDGSSFWHQGDKRRIMGRNYAWQDGLNIFTELA